MTFLADINSQVVFTVKDLVMLLGILVPFAATVLYLKWKQNSMEKELKNMKVHHDKQISSVRSNHSAFKSKIWDRLNDNNESLHEIQLSMEQMKTEFLKTILDGISKINPKP